MGKIIAMMTRVDGVRFTPLRQIKDDRGSVMHMLRADAVDFEGFGEVYFSTVKVSVIKAWKQHRRMVQNLAVPVGRVKFVIYDGRRESSTYGVVEEIISGPDNYGLLRIPAMVWYGFQGLGHADSLIANCATIPYDPHEVERIPENADIIPYSW